MAIITELFFNENKKVKGFTMHFDVNLNNKGRYIY